MRWRCYLWNVTVIGTEIAAGGDGLPISAGRVSVG